MLGAAVPTPLLLVVKSSIVMPVSVTFALARGFMFVPQLVATAVHMVLRFADVGAVPV
jgi:hypothetical protein